MRKITGARNTRRTVGTVGKPPGAADSRQHTRLVAGVGREIDDIYLQMDTQLTRMAQIQLQFDELRSKIRLL
jgi:hypothetical protein